MCNFITLIAPIKDAKAIKSIMEQHGRNATLIDNPSIGNVLNEGEYQYLTSSGHCDCGTVLGSCYKTSENFEKNLEKEITRMKRKRWSQAKIDRAIDDQGKANARRNNSGPDSIELWNDILQDLKTKLKLPYVGLFVRLYSGVIATEIFTASRHEVPKNIDWPNALTALKEDEVTIFSFAKYQAWE